MELEKTAPATSIHTAGNIRADGRKYYFGASQYMVGDNSSASAFYGNHSTISQFKIRDKEGTLYGVLYGDANGANFGLLDGDGQWSYRVQKDVSTRFLINNSEKMRILANGNVGIGITNPTNRLEVNGVARIKEVIITVANWPDYVFDASYDLPTLSEEANYIEENGHLSGFESEADMEGKMTVGDVTKRQQEKIEQMMLHLIEMNEKMEQKEEAMTKKMEQRDQEMDALLNKVNSMQQEIDQLQRENEQLKGE